MSLKKSEVLMRSLKEKLQLRLPAYLFTDSYDASGNPCLKVAVDATWTTADQWANIRILPKASLGVNSIGQAQEGFSPHVCQIMTEKSAAAAISFLSMVNSAIIYTEAKSLGTILEFYMTATTVEPTIAAIAAGTLQLTLDDLFNPLTSSM